MSAGVLTKNLHSDLRVPRGQLIADVADVDATVLSGQRGKAQGVPFRSHPARQRPVQPGGQRSCWVPPPNMPRPLSTSRLHDVTQRRRLFPQCPTLPQAGLGSGPLLPAAQPDPGTPHTRAIPMLPKASRHPARGTRNTWDKIHTTGHFIPARAQRHLER